MRMWMLPPQVMCRKHLLGEHVEMHMFAGSMIKGVSMDGYIENGLMDAPLLRQRHDELVAEMEKRGYNHKSPMQDEVDALLFDHDKKPDVDWNIIDLATRCLDCRALLVQEGLVTPCCICGRPSINPDEDLCIECESTNLQEPELLFDDADELK